MNPFCLRINFLIHLELHLPHLHQGAVAVLGNVLLLTRQLFVVLYFFSQVQIILVLVICLGSGVLQVLM